jgi:mannose-1-phosphate guanylyltransferase
MIEHQVEALAEAGVTDIVLAVNYRPDVMENAVAEVRHAFADLYPFRSKMTDLSTVREEVQLEDPLLSRD